MQYALIDRHGNIRVFNNEDELETFIRNNEGIYYLVRKQWKYVNVTEIYSHDGKYEKIVERIADMLD